MPQSLKRRFNGNSEEVVEYARTWGVFKAMDKYDVRDYHAFKKFLEEKTGNENYGINPLLGNETDHSYAEDLLDAVLSKIRRVEDEKQQLQNALDQANLKIEYYQTQEALRIEPKIQEVLALCR